MKTTDYSHAFLVGSISGKLKSSQLNNEIWKKIIMPNGGYHGYESLCTLYYKSHVDAMIQAQTQIRPRFLADISHFVHHIEPSKQYVPLSRIIEKKDEFNKIVSTSIQHIDSYYLKICALHLYFFPLNTILFGIEIDDSGSDLNALTMGHFCLMNWMWEGDTRFHDNTKSVLNDILSPLCNFLNGNSLSNLIYGGNKMKMFRTIQIEDYDSLNDSLLFEIGTNAPVGCVNGNMWLTPSDKYFNQIMNNNVVSAFKSWKGLALVDSFTLLGSKNGFNKDDWNNLYFPLIYLRCIFEKIFCFSRNNNYREDKKKGNLSKEIIEMEKYYFYTNISYNFLPNMLYDTMAKGLCIKEEKEELSKQIKEKEKRNNDLILGAVSVFAIFSVVYDFYSLMKAWSADALFIPSKCIFPTMSVKAADSGELPLFAFFLSIVAFLLTITVIWYLKSQRRK